MKVILATDGSQHAEEAAWLLAHLPHSDKLELTVVYVSNTIRLQGSSSELTRLRERVAKEEKAVAEKIFQHVKEIFEGANAALDLVVLEGQVGSAILQLAEACKSELIVIGAIGHSMFERMLGSVSDYVATHAKCSVLLVRPTGLSKRKRPIEMCFAQDESSASAAAIKQVASFGWGASTHIDVVGVFTLPFIYSEIPHELDLAELKKTIEQSVDLAAEQLRNLSPHVQTHILYGNHAGDALVEFAKKHGSDIIVLGKSNQDWIDRLILGSTSRYVLRHATCSIWITRTNPSKNELKQIG